MLRVLLLQMTFFFPFELIESNKQHYNKTQQNKAQQNKVAWHNKKISKLCFELENVIDQARKNYWNKLLSYKFQKKKN